MPNDSATPEDHPRLDAARQAFACGFLKGPTLALMVLHNAGHLGWTLGALAKATGISEPVANHVKNTLVERGLAVVRLPERDKRQVKIYLTDKGRAKSMELWRALSDLSDAQSEWYRLPPPYDPS